MDKSLLEGRRILVAEDEYLLADDLKDALEIAGAQVLGPVPSVEDASTLIDKSAAIDAAVLDVNLRGRPVFAIADRFQDRGIPFVFVTGYDRGALPDRFGDVPRLEKPVTGAAVTSAIGALLRKP